MSTLTFESSRFGTLEIAADAVIEFPAGLIGLGGSRFALVSADAEGAFHWLHSVEDASLALPVTNPWLFFDEYAVELSDDDTERVGSQNPDVWVTVRAGSSPSDFSANLRAPILVADGRGLAAAQLTNGSQHISKEESTVLIITRRAGERIMVGDDVVVEIMEIVGNSVRVGISAPRSVPVYREEIYTAVRDENRAAADATSVELPKPAEHAS